MPERILPTPEAGALRDLIQRVKESDCRDPALDADIVATLEGGEIEWKTANYTMEQYPVIKRPSTMHVQGFSREAVPHVTRGLDDSIGLVIRTLPGADRFGAEFADGAWRGWVGAPGRPIREAVHPSSGGSAVVLALLEYRLAGLSHIGGA